MYFQYVCYHGSQEPISNRISSLKRLRSKFSWRTSKLPKPRVFPPRSWSWFCWSVWSSSWPCFFGGCRVNFTCCREFEIWTTKLKVPTYFWLCIRMRRLTGTRGSRRPDGWSTITYRNHTFIRSTSDGGEHTRSCCVRAAWTYTGWIEKWNKQVDLHVFILYWKIHINITED